MFGLIHRYELFGKFNLNSVIFSAHKRNFKLHFKIIKFLLIRIYDWKYVVLNESFELLMSLFLEFAFSELYKPAFWAIRHGSFRDLCKYNLKMAYGNVYSACFRNSSKYQISGIWNSSCDCFCGISKWKISCFLNVSCIIEVTEWKCFAYGVEAQFLCCNSRKNKEVCVFSVKSRCSDTFSSSLPVFACVCACVRAYCGRKCFTCFICRFH